MRIRIILLTIVILFLTCQVFANQDNSINLAIIADQTSQTRISSIISLLEVELSSKQEVHLLERSQIDRILEEQQLSTAGLLDRNTTIRIGKLLRADAFIILSIENQSKESGDLIRVRVSETAHGLRLMDFFEQSDNTNPTETTKRIIEKIENTLKKISQPDENLIPVGIVDIHRVQLGERYKMLERTLPAMLSVRLSLEQQIIMLEREDLKVLLDEKLMTQGEETEFWSSAVLIDGYIQPNNGQLELHLNLKQAAGDILKSIIVPIDPNEAIAAIDKASTEITKQIHNSPTSVKWNPEQEAEQYYKKAQMLVAHGRYEEAIPLFEITHSLQPQNVYYTGMLFHNEWISRNGSMEQQLNTNWKPYYTDLELAELVSILVHSLHDLQKKEQLTINDLYNRCPVFNDIGNGYRPLGENAYLINSESVATEEIIQFNKETRRIWIETLEAALRQQSNQTEDPQMSIPRQIARLAWLSSVDPNELIANIRQSYSKLIMPPELGGIIQAESLRESICISLFDLQINVPQTPMISFYSSMMKNTQLKYTGGKNEEYIKELENYHITMNKIFRDPWKKYVEELGTYNDKLLTNISKLALVRTLNYYDTQSETKRLEGIKSEIIEDMFTELKNYDGSKGNKAKHQLLKKWRDFLDGPVLKFENVKLWENVCNLLIEQNDYESLSILNPGTNPFTFAPVGVLETEGDAIEQYNNLLERILVILENHKSDAQVVNTINNIRDYQVKLKERYPELVISKTTSNISVKVLLTEEQILQDMQLVKDRKKRTTFIVKVKDNIIWTMVTYFDIGHLPFPDGIVQMELEDQSSNYIGLTGFNIAQNKQIASQKAKFPFSKGVFHSFIPENDKRFVWTGNHIIEFPSIRKEGHDIIENPVIYTINNPPSFIRSIVKEDEKLWVAYGEGIGGRESGLSLYDLNTGEWEVVFCSIINDGTIFNDGKPYEIRSMIYSPPNNLYFNVSGISQPGLWKMDTNTRQLKFLWSGKTDIYQNAENNIWLKSWYYMMKFDPDSEQITTIIRPGRQQFSTNVRKDMSGLNMDMFLPESFLDNVKIGSFSHGFFDLSTCVIHNNKSWARFGKSQIIIADKDSNFDDAMIIENNILEGKPVEEFVSTPYGLVGIGEGIVGLIEIENMVSK